MLTSCGLRRATGRRLRGASSTASRRTAAVASATDGQASSVADPPRLGAGGREPLRLLDVAADRVAERGGVAERHDLAGARREHVLRVPVRRRDDAAAGRDPEGERAGGDLLTPAVRRHEDVGRGEQVGDLVDRQEAIVELDVVLEPELEHGLLERQPVPLSLAVRDVRMCPAGDHVEHVRMPLDDRRQRLDHRLDPLPGRDQPEGREQEPVAAAVRRVRSRRRLRGALQRVGSRALREHGRRAVRHDSHLFGGARAARDQQPPRRLRHHDHELGLTAQRGEHLGLMRRRLREHGVQRHDERLRELLDQREHVLAVGAAEDPVLVLEQDDVDVQPAEDPRRADVVAAHRLGDRRHEPWPLGTGRLVDDHDFLDAVDPVDARGARRGRRPRRRRCRRRAAGRLRRSRCARLPASLPLSFPAVRVVSTAGSTDTVADIFAAGHADAACHLVRRMSRVADFELTAGAAGGTAALTP